MTRTKQLLAVLLSITLVASVGLIATGGFVGAQTPTEAASVTIEDQPSDGHTVIVDSVTVPEGGFVVIHDADDLEDGEVVGSVIGVSTYLEPGTHEDVPVTMGNELDTTEVEVIAMAHMDTNGNEVYDFVTSEGQLDGAYTTGGAQETETETAAGADTATETETEADGTNDTETETETTTENGTETTTETETTVATETETADDDASGGPVVDAATIDALGDGVPSTNLEFSDQSSDGTNVTVDRVTLYRGGFVVIHDTEELEEGDALGSVIGHSGYMPPGTYEDVNITLAEPLELENDTSVNVTAMPHFETNQNLVYDFVISDGGEDGPYLQNDTETPVTETAAISAGEENATETETATETEMGTETETEMGTETETTEGS